MECINRQLKIVLLFALSFGALMAAGQDKVQKTDSVLQDVTVVTGQFKPQILRRSVYNVHIIPAERIALRNATDLKGVLNNELGIRFDMDPSLGESSISLMGMSGQNVKLLVDGIPVIDRGSDKNSLEQIDIQSIDHIEIVEGPMSVAYGTDALAGVINIITKTSQGANGFSVGARIQEESVGKNYDFFQKQGVHYENLQLQYAKDRFQFSAYGTRNNMGGWQGDTTGRPYKWFPKDQWITGSRLQYNNNRNLKAWYKFDYLQEEIRNLGEYNIAGIASDQYYLTNRHTHLAQADWYIAPKFTLVSSASYQYYSRRTQSTTFDSTTQDRRLDPNASQDKAVFKNAFLRETGNWLLSDRLNIQPGLEIKWDKALGDRILGTPTITDYSVFASAEYTPTENINIRPGLRFSKNSVYDAPPVIPSINTKFKLKDNLDLRLAYGRGFRAPALRELYMDFFDASHAIIGNPDLKAEHSNSYNASLSWQVLQTDIKTVQLTASGFYNRFSNKIDYALDPATNYTTYMNINKYRTAGSVLELLLKTARLDAGAGASYIGVYNQYHEDGYAVLGENKSMVWYPELNSNIMYRFPKVKASIGLFYKFTGKRPIYELADINAVSTLHLAKINATHWMDLSATKSIGKYMDLNAGIKNIFNITNVNTTRYGSSEAHGSGGGATMQAYGRSYFVGIRFQSPKF